MDSRSPPPGAVLQQARLVIPPLEHAAAALWGSRGLLLRLRAAWPLCVPHGSPAEPLEIQSLDGERLLWVGDAARGLEIALGAGTYHVTRGTDGAQRRYTVRLDPGAFVELKVSHGTGAGHP